MHILICLFCLLILFFQTLEASSNYDNPEQDDHRPNDWSSSQSHPYKEESPLQPPSFDHLQFESPEELNRKWGTDWAFTGISTFAHLPHIPCLLTPETAFDIGIIGIPFDTAVTYRPGARFGPRAIRAASARQLPFRSFHPIWKINPYDEDVVKVVDCGDIPVTPVDNALALRQMTLGLATLGGRKPANKDVMEKVRLVSLGGDHSIALSALRALSNIYGREKIVVVHFDAHLDTWSADKYPNVWNEGGQENMGWFNHGSMFRLAFQEGLISKKKNVHAGLRTRLSSAGDWEEDDSQGWLRISTEDIDDIGTKGIIEKILERVGEDVPVYLSFDIDVVDPGVCPGTGTPEPGGWTSREVLRILRGITAKLNVVGADVVEVAPAYDGVGEQTSLVAAQVVYEIVSGMVSKLRREKEGRGKWKDRDEL